MLIFFQIVATGLVPILKYALEVLMLLIIAPIRIKKKVRVKKGKEPMEEEALIEVAQNEDETPSESKPSENE